MSGKGTLWSVDEVRYLLDVWGEEHIKSMMENKHKNAEVFSLFSERLKEKGSIRSVEQCRIKVKKLRQKYLQIRDTLRRSGSSSEAKERFIWYDDLDAILGSRPTSNPLHVLESSQLTCPEETNVNVSAASSEPDDLAGGETSSKYPVGLVSSQSQIHNLSQHNRTVS